MIEEDQGGWSAIDEGVGVGSQDETRREALETLDGAVDVTLEARADDADAPEPTVD